MKFEMNLGADEVKVTIEGTCKNFYIEDGWQARCRKDNKPVDKYTCEDCISEGIQSFLDIEIDISFKEGKEVRT
jgi:hypothetical protein